MKNYIPITFLAGFFLLTSCDSDPKVADQMADEMCVAMALYNEQEPMTMLDAAITMLEIAAKEKEYNEVTEQQLIDSMEENSPDGYRKFLKMSQETEGEPQPE